MVLQFVLSGEVASILHTYFLSSSVCNFICLSKLIFCVNCLPHKLYLWLGKRKHNILIIFGTKSFMAGYIVGHVNFSLKAKDITECGYKNFPKTLTYIPQSYFFKVDSKQRYFVWRRGYRWDLCDTIYNTTLWLILQRRASWAEIFRLGRVWQKLTLFSLSLLQWPLVITLNFN